MERYRATRLWNEIICAFRSEMPRGRHRRQMRHYDNSFTASEAVDWLHDYLLKNHNFGSKISRTQAIQLLQKFQKSRMFEDVKRLKHEHEVFQDNNRLYKFIYNSPRKSQSGTIKSPLKVVRPPLVPMIDNKFEVNEKVTRMSLKNKERLVQKKSIEASQKHNDENVRFSGSVQVDGNIGNPVVKRPITVYDVHEMWKDSIVERLQLLLKLPSLEEILDGERVVDPRTIIHNIYRISASGVVMLIDKTEDLPHWVTSAMKCLVNWPNASGSGSCLPKYVGFETDVFRVITDYFTSFSQPLVTYDLYYLFVTIFDDGKLTIEAMQLACLMLPPVNRRHLHILLRVINKISRNEQLVLNPNSSNRDMALQELSKTIINSEKEIDYDEIMMKRLIVFLLDNCEKIFSSDSDLKLEVERNIAGLRRTQGRYTVPFDDLGTYTYCDRISIEEFEVQQKTVDPKIMSGLLEDIVTNHKLTHKEKRKKLLQFKELYPDVYMQRFPTVDSEVDVMKAKIKPSKSQLFTRLKSKRI